MVVVEQFTKMAHFIRTNENATAQDVAETFLRELWKLHGLPTKIISNMNAKFSGEFWESLCKSLGIFKKNVNCRPPPNRWPDRKNQPNAGAISTQFRQLWPRRLQSTTISWIHSQQLRHQCTRNVSILCQLRLPSTNWIDEGTRDAKPRSRTIRALYTN